MDPRDKHEVSLDEARSFCAGGPDGLAGDEGQHAYSAEAMG